MELAMNQESRTLLAITFLLAALFVVMDRVAESAPIADWWLPLVLFVIGVVFGLSSRIDLSRGRPVEEVAEEAAAAAAIAAPRIHVYEFSAGVPAPQLESAGGDGLLPMSEDHVAEAAPEDMPLNDVNVDEPAPPPVDDQPPKE